ncbi:MAG: replication factor C small subunit [Candidatus Hodarchaeaceae archaeon]|nr:replication factor C small subunit [Candidatus Hodarchaeaceae archaeon]
MVAEEIWVERYRPKELSEIIGQDEVVSRLQSFVAKKSLPHLLFAGPPGSGKTTAALCIARELFGEGWRQNFLELNASVTPETPIIVRRNGAIRRTNFAELAKEYFVDDLQEYARADDLEVLSVDGNRRASFLPVGVISRHKVDKVVRVRYEGGWVRTSMDHSVIVIDDFGSLKRKSASELKKGDLLVTFKGELEGKNQILNLKKISPKLCNELHSGMVKNPKIKSVLLNQRMDQELAWLFGLYLAEGCACLERNETSGQVIFTLSYPSEIDVLKKVGKIFEEKFGLEGKAKVAPSGFKAGSMSAVQYRIMNTQLAKFFQEHFYDGSKLKNAAAKRVPSFIYSACPDARRAFLRGYMGDACGRWGEFIRYSSRSKENLIDIAWLGRMSGLDTSCFDGEARLVWKMPSYSYLKTEFLPASLMKNLAERLGVRHKYFLRHSLYSGAKRISKHRAKELIEKWAASGKKVSELYDRVKGLIDSDLSVVLVKEVVVENYDGYVYDVSVPGAEMFFGGTTPILLHNSDERGIDTIRTKVKDYARTRPIADVPYKIVLLDESDALTPDAQHALRRTMEMYTHTCRFVLDCNYSSRIIEPIQSRCAIFRFRRLAEKDIAQYLRRIARAEKLTLTDDGIKAITYVSEGDMRRATNILQAAAAIKRKIDEKAIYEVSALARPEEVREMLQLALVGKFEEARNRLVEMLIDKGLSGQDILDQIHREIFNLDLPEQVKIKLIDKVGEFDFRLTEGANERIQLEAALAHFCLIGDRLKT